MARTTPDLNLVAQLGRALPRKGLTSLLLEVMRQRATDRSFVDVIARVLSADVSVR